jgi:cytochrome P450
VATEATRLNDELVAVLGTLVSRRRAAPPPPRARDVLDALLAHPDGLTDRQVVGATRLMMVTSHGPPGAALAWTLLRLAGRPDLVDAIRAEAAAGDEGNLFSPRSITLAVVKEALRLHPPVWLIGRTTVRRTKVGAFDLPANHRVLVSPYVVHRDPRHHSDPDEFLPQRWLTEGAAPRPHTYLPFGAGPRVCPGARLGELQVLIAVATILRDHRLDLPPVAEVTTRTSTLLVPDAAPGGWIPR